MDLGIFADQVQQENVTHYFQSVGGEFNLEKQFSYERPLVCFKVAFLSGLNITALEYFIIDAF